MYIEYLRFQIKPGFQKRFMELDQELWTSRLSKNPGFHKKEVWLNPEDPTNLVIIVWWSNREQWKSITLEEVEALDQKFIEAIGPGNSTLVETREYRLSSDKPNVTKANGR